MDRVLPKVRERVVHPAHVPLEAEADAAEIGRPADAREGGRLLGDGDDAGKACVHALVHLAQERDGLEILVAAVPVGRPLALRAGVVEVEHRGHGVDPQPIDVVALAPEQGVGDQEVADLRAAEVEDQRSPVGVLAALRVGVLVQRRAVEPAQGEVVGREVGRDPVDDHADAGVVQRLDHGGEVVGVPEARGRGVVAGHLVAPRPIERVLGHREQLDVREPERAAVLDQLLGGLAVAQPRAVGVAHPGSEVDLVRRHRRPIRVVLGAAPHPLVVRPWVGRRIPDPRRRLRPDLHAEGEGVGLQPQRPVAAEDLVLVELAGANAGDEDLPYAGGAHAAKWQQPSVPAVEVADDPHAPGVRGPDGEADAGHALVGARVRAEHVVQPFMRALGEEVQVDLADGRGVAVRILAFPGVAVREGEAQAVGDLARGEVRDEGGPHPVAERLHRLRGAGRGDELGGGRIGMEGADQRAVRRGVRAEHGVRVVVLATGESGQVLGGRARAGRVLRHRD